MKGLRRNDKVTMTKAALIQDMQGPKDTTFNAWQDIVRWCHE